MRRFAFAVAASTQIALAEGEGRLLEKALEGFTVSCVVAKDATERCAPKSEPLVSLPANLESGKAYVLNKTLPGGISDMSLSELPQRLRRAGCFVDSHPKGPKDMLFGSAGEPIFTIRCRCGGRSIQLRNRYNALIDHDATLRRGWSTSDLVVQAK